MTSHQLHSSVLNRCFLSIPLFSQPPSCMRRVLRLRLPRKIPQALIRSGRKPRVNTTSNAPLSSRTWIVRTTRAHSSPIGSRFRSMCSFHDTDVQKYTAADFRFTTKGDALYAIGFAWPAGGEAAIESLATAAGSELVQAVSLVGSEAKLRFEQRADGLHVQIPAQAPAKYAYVLRLTFERAPH